MRRGSTSGFTLIEVLVAFTIAAVLLLPLLRSFSAGVASATRTDAFTAATLIAESTLETVGPGVALVDGGGIDQQDGRYHVSASVHRYQGEGTVPSSLLVAVPYEIMVTVSWQEAARTQSVALRTLRLGPPPAPEQAP
jgi:general secretion pathway protein I